MPVDYKITLQNAPDVIQKHSQYDMRLSRFGISVFWGVYVEEFDAGQSYVDRQTQGPFSYWRHAHIFEDHSQGCILKDVVEYDFPFGIFGKLTMDLYFKNELERVFVHRHKAIQEALIKINPKGTD
jgi:ligand-binding SRPBCC domain-containing protein